MSDNIFSEYKLKILGDLQRQNEALMKLQDIVTALATDLVEIKVAAKVKTIFYGALGGAIVVAATIVAMFGTIWEIFGSKT